MNTQGRIYSVSSPPAFDDQAQADIDKIVAKSIRLSARVQQLEAVIDALLLAVDSGGVGFAAATGEMRKIRRGE